MNGDATTRAIGESSQRDGAGSEGERLDRIDRIDRHTRLDAPSEDVLSLLGMIVRARLMGATLDRQRSIIGWGVPGDREQTERFLLAAAVVCELVDQERDRRLRGASDQ